MKSRCVLGKRRGATRRDALLPPRIEGKNSVVELELSGLAVFERLDERMSNRLFVNVSLTDSFLSKFVRRIIIKILPFSINIRVPTPFHPLLLFFFLKLLGRKGGERGIRMDEVRGRRKSVRIVGRVERNIELVKS